MVASLHAKMRKIHSKMKALEWSQQISHCNLIPQFWKFKLQAFMVVLLTGKNEENPIKNEGARVFTTLFIILFLTLKGS